MCSVIEASSSEMISPLRMCRMRRTVPGKLSLFAPREESGALFRREFAPEVTHERSEAG